MAVFLSNLPEAMAATTALARADAMRRGSCGSGSWSHSASALPLWRGYVILDSASPRTVAIVLAFAGGAVLTMLANTMMPEALHRRQARGPVHDSRLCPRVRHQRAAVAERVVKEVP